MISIHPHEPRCSRPSPPTRPGLAAGRPHPPGPPWNARSATTCADPGADARPDAAGKPASSPTSSPEPARSTSPDSPPSGYTSDPPAGLSPDRRDEPAPGSAPTTTPFSQPTPLRLPAATRTRTRQQARSRKALHQRPPRNTDLASVCAGIAVRTRLALDDRRIVRPSTVDSQASLTRPGSRLTVTGGDADQAPIGISWPGRSRPWVSLRPGSRPPSRCRIG